jgi:uncharacterized protein YdhG (YjbR/CyaY superfamily)
MSDVDKYIATFPVEVQTLLHQMRSVIKEKAPDATETIKYAMPTYVLKENLVHFAGYKKHIGFYPTPSGIEKFKNEIAFYKWSKGAVQFPVDKPLPLDLIRKIVEFRVNEVYEKKQ